jgi:enamine deaminase RidA (YjgF/YER057c/UK114 family)
MSQPYEQLQKLGISLPPLSVPAAAYVPYVQTGSLIFISGHIAKQADGQPWVGRLGQTMDTAQGQQAARSICIELLGTLHAALASQGKDLGSVKRIVKLMSLVCSTPEFN